MKKVFMIHGFNGKPNGGWRPWLMGELAQKGIWACSLPMPSPDAPVPEEWVKTISDTVGEPTEDVFLIGHSLGPVAILRYLETIPEGKTIGGAVLVSGPYENIKDEDHEALAPFWETPFDFEQYKKVCKNFVVIHAVDDFVVPFAQAGMFATALNCEVIPIPNGGHLNGESGAYKLPEALEVLLKMTQKEI